MTFEEFFAKKRINLDQFEKADASLYHEFKSHFDLMGEKSFDHTKKFWFNKLRHLYHLEIQPKTAPAQPLTTKIAEQAESLDSPTIEQKPVLPKTTTLTEATAPGEKAATTADTPDTAAAGTDIQPDLPPPVTKPAFRPRNIKPLSGKPSEDAQKVESRPGQASSAEPSSPLEQDKNQEMPKPAYKPKFNARNLEKKPSDNEGQTPEAQSLPEARKAQEEAAKPAYKPRFNVKNIPPVTNKPETPTEEKDAVDVSLPAGNKSPAEAPAEAKPAEATAKPAYKPRFNVKNIPTITEKTEEAEKSGEANTPPVQADESPSPQSENPEQQAPKPAFKPRFNAKNIKPKED